MYSFKRVWQEKLITSIRTKFILYNWRTLKNLINVLATCQFFLKNYVSTHVGHTCPCRCIMVHMSMKWIKHDGWCWILWWSTVKFIHNSKEWHSIHDIIIYTTHYTPTLHETTWFEIKMKVIFSSQKLLFAMKDGWQFMIEDREIRSHVKIYCW